MEEEAFDPNLRFKEVATDLFEKDKAVVEEKSRRSRKRTGSWTTFSDGSRAQGN